MQKTHNKLEDFKRLEIQSLHKASYTTDGYTGQWGWRKDDEVQSSIDIITRSQKLILRYEANNTHFDYVVPLETTPCHYGGVRYWFNCPNCFKRVATLFLGNNLLFQCRTCQNLNYASQQQNKLDSTRLVMYRLRNRLDWEYDNAWMQESNKIRPKGMHQTTFNRLVERHDQLEAKANKYCAANFKAFQNCYKKLLGDDS